MGLLEFLIVMLSYSVFFFISTFSTLMLILAFIIEFSTLSLAVTNLLRIAKVTNALEYATGLREASTLAEG